MLVILGLLTGGILSGQSLIRASEMRAVVSEYQRYTAAVQSFRDKYQALPGDMPNATSFWGFDATYCPGSPGSAGTPGTCNGNGNGNGVIDGASAINSTGEILQFWKQMALAGLIEGSYTGISGPTTGTPAGYDAVIGTNTPKSRMNNAGWGIEGLFNYNQPADTSDYTYDYGNTFRFGGLSPADLPHASVLKPEEAWNIDTKLDDGKPGTGKVIANNYSTCANSTSDTDYAGVYQLSNPALVCALFFAKPF